MENKPRHTIQFIAILTLLWVVLLQGVTHVVPQKPLDSFEEKTAAPGDWELLAKQHTGFREFFIRNYNQVVYSCLHSVSNQHIKKGRDHELYLKMYLDEATGKTLRESYVTVDSAKAVARHNVEETLRLVDSLRNHGTAFLFVFAPAKPRVYPEKMPFYYRNHFQEFSLEDYYVELFKENGIPHIDFLSQFKAMRDTATYPVYTRTGTHWAASTLPFVADSILKKIASLTEFDLSGICCDNTTPTTDYTEQDGELEGKMNLLFPLAKPALPRPKMVLCDTICKDRPRLLVVGDSHFGTLLGTCFTDAFSQWDFWEYNKTSISSDPAQNFLPISELPFAFKSLEDADVVLAVFTAPMLYNYLFGFTRSAMDLYEFARCDSCIHASRVLQMEHFITIDSAWYQSVVKQAEEKNISVEEALHNNAEYVIWMQDQANN